MDPGVIEHHQSAALTRTGIASWYRTELTMACASNFHPKGTRLLVEFEDRRVIVIVAGTGPRQELGRIIDLSPDAFAVLAPLSRGIITVQVTPL